LFSKDTLVFSFSGKLINHLNTKAYRSSGVDPKDIQLIDKEISEIIDFSVAITKYLD